MDSYIPTPQNSQPDRDERHNEMQSDSFNVPSTPKQVTRSVPEDSEARKMFIQEVCGPRSQYQIQAVLTIE
jgi:hypothetical protein